MKETVKTTPKCYAVPVRQTEYDANVFQTLTLFRVLPFESIPSHPLSTTSVKLEEKQNEFVSKDNAL